MKFKKDRLKKILIKINPKIKSYINNNKIHLTNNGLLDSLAIIKFIAEIESITKKKLILGKLVGKLFLI